MKKITIISYLTIIFVLLFSVPSFSETYPSRLTDEADILTAEFENELQRELKRVSEKHSLDVAILTVNDIGAKTATEYADDYYDYGGYSDDGILLLVSIGARDWAVSTKGYAITVFTDAGIDYFMEDVLDSLSSGDYETAFRKFVSYCDNYAESAENDIIYDVGTLPKGDFPFLTYVIIALVIGFVIAFIVTMVMKGQLKSVRFAPNASSYIKSGSFKLTESRDLFLYSTVTKTPRPQNNSNSGGSSGHISSSGSMHGGRSGKF